MASAAPTTAEGRVIQITGPVVDIEFPAGELPAILNAVEIDREGQDPLVCEVAQHLGNNWVRTVAMTTTDGLARGTKVIDTGGPIMVPVGEATLGRVFDVLGRPIDLKGPVDAKVHLSIHREPPAFDDQVTEVGCGFGLHIVTVHFSTNVAMKNATENAEDLIDDLTLAYNKVRQSNITREMIEIATGARAR